VMLYHLGRSLGPPQPRTLVQCTRSGPWRVVVGRAL